MSFTGFMHKVQIWCNIVCVCTEVGCFTVMFFKKPRISIV